ncbi:MAG: GNAT family N-acetyltransferase, partial [candidate division Zixibacteria bacterium]|nr:GNAT family N-acetyltransferase [Gammaproteobacteria bacterium]NIX54526.1 GNAT family N-acetyltransferase [candidate division Zixibacteria bacterium]
MITKKIDPNSPSDVNRWVDFPFSLYQGHPCWIPLLKNGIKKLLDKNQHPFYQHSEADFFVVENAGEVAARICVMENTRYNDYHNEKAAFIGYFDVIEDKEAARQILSQVDEWANQRGLETIYGPKGMLGAAAGGVLVGGFEYRAAIDIPYNYPYYDDYLKDSGYEKYRDTLSGFIHRKDEGNIPERVIRISKKVAERGGFHARRFKTKAELRQIVPMIGDLHRQAFVEIPGYYPMTDEEFAWMAEELIMIADPELITLVMKDDEVVGFLFAYPDISGGLQKANGSLFPLGWWHILQAQRKTDWIILNGVGVLPEYQGRGANAIMYVELARTLLQSNFDHADLVQVGEENYRSMQDQLTFGVKWTKKHRV